MRDRRVPEIESDIRALLERTRGLDPAPANARPRVLSRIESVLTRGGAGAPSGTSRGWATGGVLAGHPWSYAAVFAVGAATGALAMRETARLQSGTIATRESMPPESVPQERSRGLAQPATASASARGDSAATPGGDRHAIPRGSMPAGSASGRVAPIATASEGFAPSTISEERALLDVARRALEREDGAAALAVTREHERRFPNGALLQEREAMAIRALLLIGNTDEARARAGRFRERYPDSLLLPAIDSLLGKP